MASLAAAVHCTFSAISARARVRCCCFNILNTAGLRQKNVTPVRRSYALRWSAFDAVFMNANYGGFNKGRGCFSFCMHASMHVSARTLIDLGPSHSHSTCAQMRVHIGGAESSAAAATRRRTQLDLLYRFLLRIRITTVGMHADAWAHGMIAR